MKKHIAWIFLFAHWLACAQNDTSAFTGGTDADIAGAESHSGAAVMPQKPLLEWSGYFQTDNRLKFDGCELNWQEYRFALKTDYRFMEQARFRSELWVRGIKFPGITSSRDLMFANEVMPVDVSLRQAFFDVYGLFTKNLDVRIGRQRIAWGTGDRFNPTDNLNPYDMEDLWEFGRHLPSDALRLDYYAGKWTFTGVGILHFTPSVLPNEDWTPAFMPAFSFPEVIYDSTTLPGLTLPFYVKEVSVSDTVILPQRTIKHSPGFGFKVKRTIGAWDLSLSYVYTRDALPALFRSHTALTVDTVVINLPVELYAEGRLDAKAFLYYPVQKIIGFDFAGSLGGVGLRGEAACFIPEKIHVKQTLHYSLQAFGIAKDSVLPDSVLLDGKPYVKFLLGFDYTFRNNFYLNFQYLHGFLHERGAAELSDYFMLGVDYPLLNHKLKLSLLNAAFQIGNWKDIGNNYALIYMPEVSYRPVDNFTILAGLRIIEGKSTTAFGKVSNNDECYLKLSFSF